MMGGGGMMGGSGGGLGGLGGGLGDLGGLMMGFGLMGLIPLLILGVIIWAVVEATRNRGTHQSSPPPTYGQAGPYGHEVAPGHSPYAAPPAPAQPRAAQAGALAILSERYARGEIDREEYLARKADLG